MSGTITLDNSGPPPWQPATPLAVAKFDPASTGEGRYRIVPNVVCERIERSIGPHASTAHFRYTIDHSGLYPDWPSQFEDIWPQTAQAGPYVFATDDRVAVLAYDQAGNSGLIFDGFACIPSSTSTPTRSGSRSRRPAPNAGPGTCRSAAGSSATPPTPTPGW